MMTIENFCNSDGFLGTRMRNSLYITLDLTLLNASPYDLVTWTYEQLLTSTADQL